MDIFFGVRVAVVMAMMRCPPQRSALYRGVADNGKDELPEPIGLKRLVGEIAMVESGNRKHADKIKPGCRQNGKPAPPYPDDPQTHQVQYHKWNDPKPIDFFDINVRYLIARCI
jgi:hypothetical protein